MKSKTLAPWKKSCDQSQFSSSQSLSHVWLFATPWAAACLAALSNTTSRAYSNSCPSSQWYCPPISLSVVPFSSWLLSFAASGSFQMSKFFTSGGQSIDFSFNISPSNEHPGLIFLRMDWLDLLAVQETLKRPPTPQFKSINSSVLSFLYSPTLTSIHDHWKNHSSD